MTRIFKLSILFLFVHLSLFAQDSKLMLHEKMKAALAKEQLTGVVWSTVDTNGYIATDAFGMKYSGTKHLLSDSDQVQAGSVAKIMLATGVFRLVTMGKLDLDTPVEKILTSIRFDNPWASTHPVRLRDLLNHTSGIQDLSLWQVFSKAVSPGTPLLQNFSRNSSIVRIQTQPGSQFVYSNMGYTLLAMVIEAVTRQRYEDYLDTYLLRPMGMKNSTFGFVTQELKNQGSRLAMGHNDQKEWQPVLPSYLRPGIQFTTTAYDMGTFLRFLMGNGNLYGYPFIRKDLLSILENDVINDRVLQGSESGYGKNPFGYHTMLYLFPEERKGFFISHNMDSKPADYQVFNRILMQSMEIPIPKALPVQNMPEDIQNWQGNYISTTPKFKVLAYFELLTGFITVFPKKDHVVFNQLYEKDKALFPIGKRLFRSSETMNVSYAFYMNNSGQYRITDGFTTYKKISSLYLWEMWMSFILGILGLLYIFIDGLVRLLTRPLTFLKRFAFLPFLMISGIGIPVYLFLKQDFMALGDQTPASISLAVLSVLLPVSILCGMWDYYIDDDPSRSSRVRMLALLLVFQFFIVLAFWGMIPFYLWV